MIPGVPRPCIKCGTLTHEGSYCTTCSLDAERIRSRARGRRHYTGDYRRRAAKVRAEAVECYWCKNAFTANNPVQADHLVPGDPESPLVPACRRCNASRGNRPDWKPSNLS